MVYFTFALLSVLSLSLFKGCILSNRNKLNRIDLGQIVAIFLMTLLTASRDIHIGVDSINYYYSANSIISNYSSVKSVLLNYYIEPGYGLLEYISMKYIGDVHFIFFVEGLILVTGLFSFIHNFEGKISYSLAFLCFFCFYYNISLNISRQYIAVGIGFWAVKYLQAQKWKPYFILCSVALLFHSTAIFLFFTYFIWIFLNKDDSNVEYKKKMPYLLIMMILLLFFFVPISSFLINIGLLPAKYAEYLKNSEASSSLIMVIIANAPLLLLITCLSNKLISYDKRNKIVITMYLLGFCISLINCFWGNVGRMAVYWASWQIILYPECCELLTSNENKRSDLIVKTLFVILMMLYWWYCFVYRGFGGTYPYESSLFNWLNWE